MSMASILLLDSVTARMVEALTMIAGMSDAKGIEHHVIERMHEEEALLIKATEECDAWYEMHLCEEGYTLIKLPVPHLEPLYLPPNTAYFWDTYGLPTTDILSFKPRSVDGQTMLDNPLRIMYVLTRTGRPNMGAPLELL